MKKIVWEHPNKMKISTGHMGFDKQTNLISNGNIIANTMYGAYIRSYNQIASNGAVFQLGHLQGYDLKFFEGLPAKVKAFVELNGKFHSLKLYEIFHHNGKKKITHGYIVTDNANKLINKFFTGPSSKSRGIINEVAKYITESEKSV